MERNRLVDEIRSWIYRNARSVELSIWKCLFEDGNKLEVVNALMEFQNEDGGFGHALEADNWNPESTPVTTQCALDILDMIEFRDIQHPIYHGIIKYLISGKDIVEYGWRFTVPGNNAYPHAPWWNYSEEDNKKEYYGVTASLSSFILKNMPETSDTYKKALSFTDNLLKIIETNVYLGDMGLACIINLIRTVKEEHIGSYNTDRLMSIMSEKVTKSIEHDTEKWAYYGVRPSNYIHSPDSEFYKENEKIVQTELDYLLATRPEGGVWGITWTWFDNMDRYAASFTIAENWWKSMKAIEKLVFLRNFHRI